LAGKGPKSRNPVGRRATPAGDPQSATPRDAGRHDASTGLSWKPKLLIAASVVAAMVLIGLALRFLTSGLMTALSNANRSDSAEAATFVGSETCAGCHRAEAELWRGSQHKRAMDHATDKSALGDFNDATFAYYGLTSRFFRHDGKFLVETDAPDGKLATFEIKYTFGVDPLQQYLVEFPDGRLQALPLAWDSRPKDKGGQRWFHIHPNEEIRHDDYLHWTRLNQNWNYMCAECHSTGVRKNYDAAKDRYATTWSEISVGCETCHGQGSDHVAWAREQQSWRPFGRRADPTEGLRVRFDERQDITWPIDPRTGNATRRIAPATLRKQVETCGLCHARRGQISEDWVPAAGSPTPMWTRPSPATSTMRADRSATSKSPTMCRSSRAGCSRPASPAAIVRAAQRHAARVRRRRLPAMSRTGEVCERQQRRDQRPDVRGGHVLQHVESADSYHRVRIDERRPRHADVRGRDVRGELGERDRARNRRHVTVGGGGIQSEPRWSARRHQPALLSRT